MTTTIYECPPHEDWHRGPIWTVYADRSLEEWRGSTVIESYHRTRAGAKEAALAWIRSGPARSASMLSPRGVELCVRELERAFDEINYPTS